ncbi:hypothetical protein DRO56_03605 [Candidatus Bathyarchaeota archaeon]|nr:MAG: hypothetical protein DRO56_03605 [Candidatus Bathyarchaeota archaeon]
MSLPGSLDRIKSLLGEKVCILFHHNADPDALCSAYALSRLLRRIREGVEVTIAPSKDLSKISEGVAEHLAIPLEEEPDIEGMDLLFLVDTGSLQQLEEMKDRVLESGVPIVVIDHHAEHPETREAAAIYVVDEKATSTCEILYEFYREEGIKPDDRVAKALLIGIAYDTRHFAMGTPRTFRAVSELLELDGELAEIFSLLSHPMDRSERIARLKAGQRMKLHLLGRWLVVSTEVSSYQASAARGLLSLGADLAIVGGSRDGEVRVSMRSTEEFYRETSIHLGRDVAMPLGEAFGGMGSGHSTSAGVNAFGDVNEVLERAVRILDERITHI